MNIYAFLITSRSFLLRMRSVSDKSCRGNQNSDFFVCSETPPLPPENGAVYEKTWKNIVERGRPQMTVLRMRINKV